MPDSISLTIDETAALADLLNMLAVMERKLLKRNGMIEVSREAWRDLLGGPAARLHRITRPRLENGT